MYYSSNLCEVCSRSNISLTNKLVSNEYTANKNSTAESAEARKEKICVECTLYIDGATNWLPMKTRFICMISLVYSLSV